MDARLAYIDKNINREALEVVSQRHLPRVRTATDNLPDTIEHGNFASLATNDVIVCAYLQMAEQHHTGTNVDTEIGSIEVPIGHILYESLVLVTNVKAELRTRSQVNSRKATQTDVVTQVDGDVYGLLLQFRVRPLDLSLTLVVESRGIDAKTYNRQSELNRRADEKPGTVGSLKQLVAAKRHIGDVETSFKTELKLGLGRYGHKRCRHEDDDSKDFSHVLLILMVDGY